MENQILTEDFKEKKTPLGVVLHHDKTGEPLFDVNNKSHSRDVELGWHAHQLAIHPHLKDSFEFSKPPVVSSKMYSRAAYATNLYSNAAHAGFKDVVPHTTSKLSDEEFDKRASHYENEKGYEKGYISRTGNSAEKDKTVVTFHDPDTNMKIAHVEYDHELGDRALKYNPEYLQHHNISNDALQTYHKTGLSKSSSFDVAARSYHPVKELYLNKGKQPRLTGLESKNSGHEYQSFKINTTPEQASVAHEEHIRNKHPQMTIVRHSPVSFLAHSPAASEYSSGYLINSNVIGDTLHSSKSTFSHPDYHSRTANNMIIEGMAHD